MWPFFATLTNEEFPARFQIMGANFLTTKVKNYRTIMSKNDGKADETKAAIE